METQIRPLDGISECREAVRLQEAVWGEGFSERVPASVLHVLPRVGSVALGAFDPEGRIVGLVFGVTGVERGRIVHWSDILGVVPGARDQGLGRRLKEAQRIAAREAGAEKMYWTADPLEARNAWFNLEVLGATSRDYRVDFYGVSDSPLHRGIGTDRLVMEWDLREREGEHRHREIVDRVAIPRDLQGLKAENPAGAVTARRRVRERLLEAFAAGAELTGVVRARDSVELLLSASSSDHTS